MTPQLEPKQHFSYFHDIELIIIWTSSTFVLPVYIKELNPDFWLIPSIKLDIKVSTEHQAEFVQEINIKLKLFRQSQA